MGRCPAAMPPARMLFLAHMVPRKGAEAGWEMESGQPRHHLHEPYRDSRRRERQAHQQGHAARAVRPQPHAVPKVPQVCPHVLDRAVNVAPLFHAHARQLHHDRLQQAGPAQCRCWAKSYSHAGCRLEGASSALTAASQATVLGPHLDTYAVHTASACEARAHSLAPEGSLRKVQRALKTPCGLLCMPHAD